MSTLSKFAPFRRPKIGLALGSGAARGWAHIGVIRALEKAGIRIDMVAGTSAGAVIGAFYAAGALTALEDFANNYRSLRVTFSMMDFTLTDNGLLGGKRFVKFLQEHLPVRSFEELQKPLGICATNLNDMQEAHIFEGSLLPAIRASVAIPGFLSPQEHGEMLLVDGGVLNPVPVSLARKMGADIVIAVDLDGHAGREMNASLMGVMKGTINTMMNRIRLDNRIFHPADITIEPGLSDIGFMDYHRTSEAIAGGLKATNNRIDEIRNITSGAYHMPQMPDLPEFFKSMMNSLPGKK